MQFSLSERFPFLEWLRAHSGRIKAVAIHALFDGTIGFLDVRR
jgi:hypothetical protein